MGFVFQDSTGAVLSVYENIEYAAHGARLERASARAGGKNDCCVGMSEHADKRGSALWRPETACRGGACAGGCAQTGAGRRATANWITTRLQGAQLMKPCATNWAQLHLFHHDQDHARSRAKLHLEDGRIAKERDYERTDLASRNSCDTSSHFADCLLITLGVVHAAVRGGGRLVQANAWWARSRQHAGPFAGARKGYTRPWTTAADMSLQRAPC